VKPRLYAWIACAVLFAGATVWLNYEVKVKIQSDGSSGGAQQLSNLKVGQPAPDFSAKDLAGHDVRLADYRGQKVVLIDFWATWCMPCQMAMPGLQKVLDNFKDRGLEVLSVDQGESSEQAGSFMKKKGYGFHVLLDTDSEIGDKYGVRAIPTLVAVDKAGVVRFIRVGYRQDESDLRQVLETIVKQ